jgi:hypothetical protein
MPSLIDSLFDSIARQSATATSTFGEIQKSTMPQTIDILSRLAYRTYEKPLGLGFLIGKTKPESGGLSPEHIKYILSILGTAGAAGAAAP